MSILSDLDPGGLYIGRIWRSGIGPCVVAARNGRLADITSLKAPTVRDVFELDNPSDYLRNCDGVDLGAIEDIVFLPANDSNDNTYLLAPCDLQAIKACGVTFARSMIERVIEERASGDPAQAETIRLKVASAIGENLHNIVPGSPEAAAVKKALIAEGLWSQYLEVGIGPDAEVFTKAQVMSSVGANADIGLHPSSVWNNPEPEIVLAVASTGKIVGATLGNDVNLRDIEGRSALLLGKAKDNNASCSIGPMIRLFDSTFSLAEIRRAELTLRITGPEGFVLEGRSDMREISRDPEDLVRQTIGRHHQYPDGFMLFLGTLFAPTQDRDQPGNGFTHKVGDIVEIASAGFGTLRNTVRLSTECSEWVFGASHLLRNLAARKLV